ncbi:MAG: ABC transporter substrate-binding protein [Betaproteobacteria bacterium]|nr:ABC transporter substrate-binding protein [Betaproteobacteria bacterium]
MSLDITIATWDYDRVRPLIDGRVKVEGCNVRYLSLAPEECFRRAYIDKEFEVSEIGLSPYLIAFSRGISPYVALPVFLSRMFRHSSIYKRNDRGINTPSDLIGKKVGVVEYQMSAVLWIRGMLLDDHGIHADQIQWYQSGLNTVGRKEKFPLNLPDDFPLITVESGETLSEMLENGFLDAVISPQPPDCYQPSKFGTISRLFEKFALEEKEYYKRTKIFPIMHALGIREDIHRRHPWLVKNLFRAFEEAKKISAEDLFEMAAPKIGLPWIVSHAAETVDILGDDFWPYGIVANRHTLEAMMRYSYEQGLAVSKLNVDSIFAT